MQRVLILLIALSLGLSACNRGAEEDSTTTSTTSDQEVTRTTSSAPSDDSAQTDSAEDDGTDEENVQQQPSELPGYSIVRREGAEGGDRLVVLLETFEYTDRILEELVFDITEVYAPVLEAYLIDDLAAADLLLVDPEGLSEADRAFLDDHLFVSLTSGNLVTFEGPFADMGEFRLGS
jgi:hypothetical protein